MVHARQNNFEKQASLASRYSLPSYYHLAEKSCFRTFHAFVWFDSSYGLISNTPRALENNCIPWDEFVIRLLATR